MNIVLVGSAGTGNAFATVIALRKWYSTNCKIILTDTNPPNLVTARLFADEYYRVSEYTDPQFESEISQIIADNDVQAYFPFIDGEVLIAAKLYEEGKISPGVKLQVKETHTASICNDKLKTYEFLKRHDIPTPETFLLDAAPESTDKFILKPRRGFGSKTKIISYNEISAIEEKEDYIGQEICAMPEITVDVSHSKKYNAFFYLCRERIQTKSGVCTKARVFQDAELGGLAYKISQLMNLHSFCFQVMKIKSEWVVTDINPRLGAGTNMSNAAGFDFFSAMLHLMNDENPKGCFPKYEGEFYITRQYADYLM